jgi:hypothetical protein
VCCRSLADGTLVATPDIPDEDLIPSLLTTSDVFGTGWFAAIAANVQPGMTGRCRRRPPWGKPACRRAVLLARSTVGWSRASTPILPDLIDLVYKKGINPGKSSS